MQINIYKDPMQKARLFGAPVLYSTDPIPREDIPQGWYCYDLRGTARHPGEPYACPETPLRHLLRPASPEEAGFFYAQTPEKDEEMGAIGHVRIDFGYEGKEFWHTWWPRGPEELNTQEFRDELGKVVNDLRQGILKDRSSMRRCCYGIKGAIEGGSCCQNYGFTLETERYRYRLRCNPIEGDYQAYLSCFVRQEQELGLTEQGRQRLKDAAARLQRMLEEGRAVGRVTFASGEQWNFTDPQKYLQVVREELPCQATTGFRCETLTGDPVVRKAVDDMIYDLYGEENPHGPADYGDDSRKMGAWVCVQDSADQNRRFKKAERQKLQISKMPVPPRFRTPKLSGLLRGA